MHHSVLTRLFRYVRAPGTCTAFSERLKSGAPQHPAFGILREFRTSSVKLDSKNEKNAKEEPKPDVDDDEDEETEADKARMHALSTQTFFASEKRNKETFGVMIQIFKDKNKNRKGAVEFINAAVKHMEDYNVAYDLDTYKKLVQILPEGKYVPENVYQEEFFHYPKQQDCIVSLLDAMESKGVCPDIEMGEILKRIFGPRGQPVKKVWRQLYWFPKFKNASPWPVPFPPVFDTFTLAKLAIQRIVSVDPQSTVTIWETKSVLDAIDHTYIVSGQSPTQQRLLAEHETTKSLFVEGPVRIWVGRASVNYFILRGDPKEFKEVLEDPDDVTHFNIPFMYDKSREVAIKPSVHELADGTIMAVCASGTSSRDSLLSWIRLLEKHGNPSLAEIPVIFSLKAPVGDIASLNEDGTVPPLSDDPERVSDK